MPNVKYLVVHHTAGNKNADISDERTMHLNQGFKEIAYNCFIKNDGTVQAGRNPNNPNYDQNGANHGLNSKSISVSLAGNFEYDIPTKKQIDNLIQVLAIWCKRYNLKETAIIGHHQVKDISKDNGDATLCPGKNMIELLPMVREAVKKYLIH